jgi:hypothetical protein
MHEPELPLPPDSALAACLDDAWALIPLRIPTGWAIRWNAIMARRLPSGLYAVNDSEDLFWATRNPPPDTETFDTNPESRWREIQVDAGWYRTHFRIDMLDPDWDNVRQSYSTAALDDFVTTLEAWLRSIASTGEPPATT